MPNRGKRFKPEDARDCRAAVTLALILSRRWGQDLFVCTSVRAGPYYVIFDGPAGQPPRAEFWNCYRVTPAGEVSPYPDFPATRNCEGGVTTGCGSSPA